MKENYKMNYKNRLKEQLNELMHEIIWSEKEMLKDKKHLHFIKLCEQDITIISMISNDEKLTAKEISERLKLPKTTIVTAVQRLVKRGYVIQIRSEVDKREKELKLSKKGKRINQEHLEYEDNLLEFLVSKWTEEQQEQLYLLIKNRRK
ncbi:MAG: MarR family transcriptional regulator [Clostridiales bacterium]|jgi:DNA-binding MarR family transcriptional regulator|nr:MarR family transcriptional regulator [Clostridiales bacterium]